MTQSCCVAVGKSLDLLFLTTSLLYGVTCLWCLFYLLQVSKQKMMDFHLKQTPLFIPPMVNVQRGSFLLVLSLLCWHWRRWHCECSPCPSTSATAGVSSGPGGGLHMGWLCQASPGVTAHISAQKLCSCRHTFAFMPLGNSNGCIFEGFIDHL